MRALSAGSSCADERFGGRLDQADVGPHAAAAIEHHDDGDRLDVVREDRDRLRLAVVVDLEVVAREIRHEPAAGVGDRRVDRDRARAALERLLPRRQRETEPHRQGGGEQKSPRNRRGDVHEQTPREDNGHHAVSDASRLIHRLTAAERPRPAPSNRRAAPAAAPDRRRGMAAVRAASVTAEVARNLSAVRFAAVPRLHA